jgi:predicted Zn-dependent peptidase
MSIPSTPPGLQSIDAVELPSVEKRSLSNGVPVYCIHADEQDVIRLEAIFEAGRSFENKAGQANSMARLLSSGTEQRSAAQIHQELERYGAHFKVNAGFDYLHVNFHLLNRLLDQVLPVFQDVFNNASFPQSELDIFVRNAKQKLLIQQENNDYLADVGLREALYGAAHPYGYRLSAEVYDAITSEDLKQHQNNLHTDGLRLIVAGNVRDEAMNFLEALFGSMPSGNSAQTEQNLKAFDNSEKLHVVKAGSVQSALRIAKPIMRKQDPDFPSFLVLNTLLGGFFGSRLMSNIREDKGYTYGIYSGMGHMNQASHLYISSEVGIDVCEAALKEIYFELEKLQHEVVSEEELGLVRNYMLGSMMGSVDGPFRTADTVRGLLMAGLPETHIAELSHTIRDVSALKLQELAQQYLAPDSFLELVVGWPETEKAAQDS